MWESGNEARCSHGVSEPLEVAEMLVRMFIVKDGREPTKTACYSYQNLPITNVIGLKRTRNNLEAQAAVTKQWVMLYNSRGHAL
jgi:hypothetical protein